MTAENLLDFLKSGPMIESDTEFFIEVGIRRFFCQDYVSALHILVPRLESFVKKCWQRLTCQLRRSREGPLSTSRPSMSQSCCFIVKPKGFRLSWGGTYLLVRPIGGGVSEHSRRPWWTGV